jgi:hypothetical protein
VMPLSLRKASASSFALSSPTSSPRWSDPLAHLPGRRPHPRR